MRKPLSRCTKEQARSENWGALQGFWIKMDAASTLLYGEALDSDKKINIISTHTHVQNIYHVHTYTHTQTHIYLQYIFIYAFQIHICRSDCTRIRMKVRHCFVNRAPSCTPQSLGLSSFSLDNMSFYGVSPIFRCPATCDFADSECSRCRRDEKASCHGPRRGWELDLR